MERVLSQIAPKASGPLHVSGLRAASSALFIARAAEKKQAPVMCVVPSEAQLSVMEQDVKTFTTLPVFTFPGYEIPHIPDFLLTVPPQHYAFPLSIGLTVKINLIFSLFPVRHYSEKYFLRRYWRIWQNSSSEVKRLTSRNLPHH